MLRSFILLRLRPLRPSLRALASTKSHPTLARFSPWSDNFSGTHKSRIFLQSAFYAVLIVGTTELLDSYLFPEQQAQRTVSQYASPQKLQEAIQELRNEFPRPSAVITDSNVLSTYGFSENSYHPISSHSVIVRPMSTDEVVSIVNIARKYRVPIVPYSGATSLEGHFSGYPSGSICVDISGMNRILEINEADSDLICQAGARWDDINETLHSKGIPLFFPLDPGPGATISGMISTGCSGTNAVRYGTARGEWFLNLTVVLPNGEVIKTRRRARKSAVGFDLTKLFTGAEGTLGIVTEATLRLAPVFPTKVAMAQFPDVEHAVIAVQEILNTPQGPHIRTSRD